MTCVSFKVLRSLVAIFLVTGIDFRFLIIFSVFDIFCLFVSIVMSYILDAMYFLSLLLTSFLSFYCVISYANAKLINFSFRWM